MKHNTHYFIAVPIEKEQQTIIQNWLATKKDKLPFQSWVHQNDYHITLAFLGHVDSNHLLKQLSERINNKMKNIQPFILSLKGMNVFGRSDAPRIFWAGVEDSISLDHLQSEVFQACTEIGFTLDSKPFRPHITLARRWKSERPFEKIEEFQQAFTNIQAPFRVNKIHLYRTHLDRSPKYEAIEVFPLQGEQ